MECWLGGWNRFSLVFAADSRIFFYHEYTNFYYLKIKSEWLLWSARMEVGYFCYWLLFFRTLIEMMKQIFAGFAADSRIWCFVPRYPDSNRAQRRNFGMQKKDLVVLNGTLIGRMEQIFDGFAADSRIFFYLEYTNFYYLKIKNEWLLWSARMEVGYFCYCLLFFRTLIEMMKQIFAGFATDSLIYFYHECTNGFVLKIKNEWFLWNTRMEVECLCFFFTYFMFWCFVSR